KDALPFENKNERPRHDIYIKAIYLKSFSFSFPVNIPEIILQKSKNEQIEYLQRLQTGESVHCRGSNDSFEHILWKWEYLKDARPNIVRSCIGLHEHSDIYIIGNKAYREPSKYHALSREVRSLLYSFLLLGKYTLKVNEESHVAIFNKLRERYFTDLPKCTDIGIPTESLSEISQTQENEFTFQSDTIRHDVMYAFVTECLTEDSDLEFFLSTASHQVILEYCRSWKYERSEGERCLYVPSWPEKLYDLFIDRLQIDTIIHCQASDKVFCDAIQARCMLLKFCFLL
ncbi:uncharacterized protein LOC134281134, partial [Saccostrea cucullata]|uniref:uncharacterized protein LOC134281134 n=1 Tax=Saccostrea cuccullata TaxID=36930 RepID=UPI002ED0B222